MLPDEPIKGSFLMSGRNGQGAAFGVQFCEVAGAEARARQPPEGSEPSGGLASRDIGRLNPPVKENEPIGLVFGVVVYLLPKAAVRPPEAPGA